MPLQNGTDSQCTNSFIEQDAQCFDCGALLDPVTVPNQVQLAQTSLDRAQLSVISLKSLA
jgi:hypothetical protein